MVEGRDRRALSLVTLRPGLKLLVLCGRNRGSWAVSEIVVPFWLCVCTVQHCIGLYDGPKMLKDELSSDLRERQI